jgi:hypothetical protein
MKFIETNGVKVPVNFGMLALSQFTDRMGISMNELSNIGNKMKLSDAIWLVYYGVNDGARITGKEKVSYEECADMMDDDNELINKCFEALNQSFGSVENKGKPKKTIST